MGNVLTVKKIVVAGLPEEINEIWKKTALDLNKDNNSNHW